MFGHPLNVYHNNIEFNNINHIFSLDAVGNTYFNCSVSGLIKEDAITAGRILHVHVLQ